MSKRASRPAVQQVEGPRWWERRVSVVLTGLFIFLFVLFAYAGTSWAAAMYRLLTDGPLLLLWLAAMYGVGTWVAKLFASREERLGFATCMALGIGSFSLLILLFGWGGVLNRPVAWILIGFGIALAGLELSGRGLIPSAQSDPANSVLAEYWRERLEWTSWLWLVVVPFLSIAVLGALMLPGILWRDEPHYYDVVEYHLQVPREWFEAGRIIPLQHNVFSYFPFNVEVHYLLAMHLRGGPWAGMYLAQLMHVAMIVLAVVAVAGWAGRKGVGGALLAACTPWLTLLAPVAYNEGGVLLFGTLAIGWAWKAIGDPAGRTRAMALAGVMAGFASGAKLTAVPMLLAAIPVMFALAVILRKERDWLKPAAAFVACGLVVLSPWLIRNMIWAHNPVFPEAMSIFGRGHFSSEQAERWRLAYVPPIIQRSLEGRLNAAWHQIAVDWRFGFVLIPAGIFAVARGKWRSESIFLIGLLALWLVFWLFFTHLQSRFFVLAIPVIALLVARVEAPIARLTLICGVLLQAGFGLLNLHAKVQVELQPYLIALGIDHYPELDERLSPVIHGTHHLCLIGDARGFVYEMPMSRLHYRTVFDVDVRGRDAVTAWSDGCLDQPGDAKYIDYDELRRFAWRDSTASGYWKIPAPPDGASGRAIIISGK